MLGFDRWLFRRSLVADGNFTVDHMKMRCPEDVNLTHGYGYVVEEGRHKQHLSDAQEFKEVPSSQTFHLSLKLTAYFTQRSTCHNHKAINAVNTHQNNLESTGIGACAFARHGCFVPHLVVEFQKGQRYVKIKCATGPLPILDKADQYVLF